VGLECENPRGEPFVVRRCEVSHLLGKTKSVRLVLPRARANLLAPPGGVGYHSRAAAITGCDGTSLVAFKEERLACLLIRLS
jgi:hypothetical protein